MEIVGICPEENVDRVIEIVQEIMSDCLPKPLNGIVLEADADYGDSYAEAK